MDDGRILRLQNHRLEQPAEQMENEVRENVTHLWVKVELCIHHKTVVATLCVPDGVQSVCRVCFFYRVMEKGSLAAPDGVYNTV